MCTVRNSSHLLGGWPSVMAFCCDLLLWPSGLVAFRLKAAFWLKVVFCYGLLVWWPSGSPDDHTRRLPSIRRPPNQKGITEGHNRRPHQPSPPEQAPSPLGTGTPWTDPPKLPPWVWAWKPARHAGIPPAMHAGIAPPCGQNDRHVLKHNLRNFVMDGNRGRKMCLLELPVDVTKYRVPIILKRDGIHRGYRN